MLQNRATLLPGGKATNFHRIGPVAGLFTVKKRESLVPAWNQTLAHQLIFHLYIECTKYNVLYFNKERLMYTKIKILVINA
jgi:hypothetical protein